MFASIQTVMQLVEQTAPKHLAEAWDNVGLQLGDPRAETARILIALDLDDAVAAEAARRGADLVLVHHPLLFKPVQQIRYDLPLGRLIRQLVQNGTAAYVAHTNLDNAAVGVNSALAERLGLTETRPLEPLAPEKVRELALTHPDRDWSEGFGLGKIGYLPDRCPLGEFARTVKAALGCQEVRVCGERNREVSKVAVCGGSGSGLAAQAAGLGADVLLTGDVKYHDAQTAERLGIAVIDAGHAATELPVIPFLAGYLQMKLKEGGYETTVVETKLISTQFWAG